MLVLYFFPHFLDQNRRTEVKITELIQSLLSIVQIHRIVMSIFNRSRLFKLFLLNVLTTYTQFFFYSFFNRIFHLSIYIVHLSIYIFVNVLPQAMYSGISVSINSEPVMSNSKTFIVSVTLQLLFYFVMFKQDATFAVVNSACCCCRCPCLCGMKTFYPCASGDRLIS